MFVYNNIKLKKYNNTQLYNYQYNCKNIIEFCFTVISIFIYCHFNLNFTILFKIFVDCGSKSYLILIVVNFGCFFEHIFKEPLTKI